MPIYEYVCKDCQEITEVLQKISDPTPSVCPHCQKHNTLSKRISQTSFVLKGGGWYTDAYAGKKPAPAAKEKAAASTEKPETKTESKTKKDN